MATTKTFTPEVSDILAALLPAVQAALGDNLVGVYLRGSLATGDFIDTSDMGRHSAKVGAGDAVWVTGWPFHKLDSIAIWIRHEAGSWSVLPSRVLRFVEDDALLGEAGQRGVEVVHLHDDVAEAGADFKRFDPMVVDQFQGHNLAVTREVEHHQDRFISDRYPPDLPEADFLVEVHRAVEILHPVGGVESLH